RHTRWPRDWSSDVCSSDLAIGAAAAGFLLVPLLGVTITLFTAAGLNVLIAVSAWRLSREHDSVPRLSSPIELTSATGPSVVVVEIGRASCRERGEEGVAFA